MTSMHTARLVDELETERRLLEDLGRILAAQRNGISGDDLAAIDESVYSAQRVLRTLREARERRRMILKLLGVDAELSPRDFDVALGMQMTDEIRAARNALLGTASRLAREASLNRRVIDGAMDIGSRLLRLFSGVTDEPNLYALGHAQEPVTTATGVLVNTRV
jgi:hypothetical protein